MTPVYEIHGLRVRSDLQLPATRATTAECVDLEVLAPIRAPVPSNVPSGRLLCNLENPSGGYAVVHHDSGYTCRFFRRCDFDFDRNLDRLRMIIDPSTSVEWAEGLLGGSILALRCFLAGDCVLHASALSDCSGVIALAGPSGSGKSSLAAAGCAVGGKLITDDVLRLGLEDAVVCYPGTRELRLRPSASQLGAALPNVTRRDTADGRVGLNLTQHDRRVLPLNAIVLPELLDATQAADLRRLPAGAESVRLLLAAARPVGVVDPACLQRQFAQLAQLARRVPIFRLLLPRLPSAPRELLEQVMANVFSRFR